MGIAVLNVLKMVGTCEKCIENISTRANNKHNNNNQKTHDARNDPHSRPLNPSSFQTPTTQTS
jgi:hypothetical protein